MGSNDIFQQRVSAQAKENQQNPEKTDTKAGDRNPGLLKRVGKSLLRIAQAPLHVVGGALEATGHLLHGRLDRSVRSLAGGVKAGFGSLHEGIREIPLVGDVIQKVEKAAFGIKENMQFTKEDTYIIESSEEKLKKAVEGVLSKYDGVSDDELVKKTEELRKQVVDEISKKKEVDRKELSAENYNRIKTAIPGAPQNFTDLSFEQKKALQSMYFDRDKKPDLHVKEVSQYFEKLMVASKTNATEEEKNDYHIFTVQNHESLRKSLIVSQLESKVFDYYLNKAEIARRKQRDPNSTIGDTLGGDGFILTGH